MTKSILTVERLREVLDYDTETGVFRWKIANSKRTRVGSIAGCVRPDGYCGIRVDSSRYYAHRLAWLFVFGEYPVAHIDHIDGDPSNNRLCNLRDVRQALNIQNQRQADRDSKSGILGVVRRGNRYCSSIGTNGRTTYLGTFATAELAHQAYVDAKRRMHPGCTI
jgi:hypothetical protein